VGVPSIFGFRILSSRHPHLPFSQTELPQAPLCSLCSPVVTMSPESPTCEVTVACLVTGLFSRSPWTSSQCPISHLNYPRPLSQTAPGLCTPDREALSYHLVPVEIFAYSSPQGCLLPPPDVSHCNRHPLEVSLLPPSLDDLYIAQNATISCLVSGMETPHSLEVSWNRGSWGPLVVVSRDPVLQEDGTCNATSILRVCVEEWQAGEEFTCTVNLSPVGGASSNLSGSGSPSVYVSPPHTEELALQEPTHITCLASGFQPRHILVTWTQQDRPVPQEAYINIGPMQEAGKEERYFIYSKLNVLASEWELGNTYTCVVGHKGLSMTFIHRSVDKSSGKPTAVNVSVILSDTNVTCY
uniref:Ig-like domain-containing protein n=1 Tax=Chelonoidis abingdonii TaxID=106734 RepID=A0A8C0QRP1_CHEAB